jgi:hypothetical protein
MAAQFLTISKLSNIISMITLGQQSGILRVIRGQGAVREVGQIQFINGSPTSALLGQLTGANAMAVLSNWGECIYSFEELAPSEMDLPRDPYGGPYGGAASDPSYNFNSGPFASGSWPSYGFPSSAPPTPPASPSQMPTTNPLQGGYTSQPSYRPAQHDEYPQGYPPSYAPGMPGGPRTGGLPSMDGYYGGRRDAPPPGPAADALDPRWLLLVPRRTMLSEHIEQLPLDRRERMVLLLVDGQRNLSDLARLTRRSERELLAVLDYLAGLGLVNLQG